MQVATQIMYGCSHQAKSWYSDPASETQDADECLLKNQCVVLGDDDMQWVHSLHCEIASMKKDSFEKMATEAREDRDNLNTCKPVKVFTLPFLDLQPHVTGCSMS
jgi:hypothetical protein